MTKPRTWYVARMSNAHDQGLVIDEATGANIAVTYASKDTPLIAAAPELLAALEALVNCPDYAGIRTHEMRAAHDAIAKARGTS